MTYTEENIGLDANIFYKHLLAQRREMKEIRGYINEIIGKLIKVINQLDRKCPQLKRELLEMLVEEIADCMRKTIQKNHRTLDAREICQVWAEIEFYQRFLNNFKVPSIEKCFTNLRKIFSKSKGLSKLATESEIFPDEFRKSKESLIKKELVRNKLLQSCLD